MRVGMHMTAGGNACNFKLPLSYPSGGVKVRVQVMVQRYSKVTPPNRAPEFHTTGDRSIIFPIRPYPRPTGGSKEAVRTISNLFAFSGVLEG